MNPDLHDPQKRLLLLAGAGLCGLSLSGLASSPVKPYQAPSNPFTLGVASGEPSPDGFVIWTRLGPDLRVDGGMPPHAVEVRWEVAEDEGFRNIVRKGVALAEPEWAHSVHVEVALLKPERHYWYRFFAGGYDSAVGRSRTLPRIGAPTPGLNFAVACCQNYESGLYAAYRHMAAQDHYDFVLHLGDYIYESNMQKIWRPHPDPVPVALWQYRRRHSLYKLDPHLQAAHAKYPWMVMWDDHDVDNDYAGEHSASYVPAAQFLLRRAAAYQAYYEHMPLRASARPRGPWMQLYRDCVIGDLLSIHLLDTRQYRSDQPCQTPERGGGRLADCEERHLPQRTMLGAQQEQWLDTRLGRHKTTWSLIAQSLVMAPFESWPGPVQGYWTDGWEGYTAARQRLLDQLARSNTGHPIVLGGDLHFYWAADLTARADRPDSPVIGSEFVCTGISSQPSPHELYVQQLPEHPHIKYFEGRRNGYMRCRVTPGIWRSDFLAVADVRQADSGSSVLQRFVVEAGRPGVHLL